MRIILSLLLMCALLVPLAAQNNPLAGENDSVSYSLGLIMGTSIGNAGIKQLNDQLFLRGMKDAIEGNQPVLTAEQANMFLNQYVSALTEKKANENLIKGREFLAENAKKDGVITLPSGLQYKVIVQGAGNSPVDTSFVTVHYTGRDIEGKVFDSSIERGQPAQFPVNGVIAGWTEALKLMKPGSKWILYLPPDLAYGETGNRSILPNSVLVFEVELISFD